MIMARMFLLTLVLCYITMTVGLILDPKGKILPIGFKGNLSFDKHDLSSASHDFGGQVQAVPLAVYHPVSAEDIAALIKSVYESTDCGFTVSARGYGHSAQGQSLTSKGIVIKMNELANKPVEVRVNEKHKYVDVWGGELWIDLLKATLAYGLAPKSWTDYLYLSVGGTLSNAGISGQAYNYGPQISNVYELDVVTGKGELKTCSEEQNSELFHAVLGGLGQFGIITRARIALEPSPQRVRWIKVMYSNFSAFTQDQEYLISLNGQPQAADYVEGSVIVDPSRINNWRSSFSSSSTNPGNISSVAVANQSVLYSLEITKNYNQSHAKVDEDIEALLEKLSYIPETNSTTDISYVDFLDRVHKGELILRSQGLWDVPHPWLNLFVPKSRIEDFDKGVFKGILGNNTNGTVLVYPLNKSKWDDRSSAVTPDEDIFYLVAFLRSAFENQGEPSQTLQYLNNQNRQILSYCDENGIKIKQYFPHFEAKQEWIDHFGDKWSTFYRQKMDFDPKHILATGQGIFQPSEFAYYQGNI